MTVEFTQLDASGTTAWEWTWGDGQSCNSSDTLNPCGNTPSSPTHVYQQPGLYTVTLVARRGTLAGVERREGLIDVRPIPPNVALSASTTAGIVPFSVVFTGVTTGTVTSHAWSFGDGTTSTSPPPVTKLYTQVGTFQASLTVAGPGGTFTTPPIQIDAGAPPPQAQFTLGAPSGPFGTEIEGEIPLAVAFRQTNTAYTTSRTWTFGDGATSNAPAPTHTYSTPGIRSPRLQATGPGGVHVFQIPDAVMAYDLLADGSFEGQVPGSVPAGAWRSFTGNAGGPDRNVIQPPTPTLRDGDMPTEGGRWCAIDAQSTDDATPPSNPGGVGQPPQGGAGISQMFSLQEGQRVLSFDAVFVSLEDPGETEFRDWMSVDVSNGTVWRNVFYRDTTNVLPSHPPSTIYASARLAPTARVQVDLQTLFPSATPATHFEISVQVGNGGDESFPSKGYIDAIALSGVNAEFSAAPTSIYRGQAVTFVDESFTAAPPAGTTWLWDFGDGTTSTLRNPLPHTYVQAGLKTVSLTVDDGNGPNTEVGFIDVRQILSSFTSTRETYWDSTQHVRSPLLVHFRNEVLTQNSLPGVRYRWFWGPTQEINPGLNVDHVFTNGSSSPATFVVTLRAELTANPSVFTDSAPLSVVVQPPQTFTAIDDNLFGSTRCGSCHNTFGTSGNFELDATTASLRTALLTQETQCSLWNGDRYVIPNDTDNSYLYYRLSLGATTGNCVERRMPIGSFDRFSGSELDQIRSWIESGAQ